MILCPAQPFDLPSIMNIERAAFIPPIQEKQNSSVKTVTKAGHAVNAGYFCSELWLSVPADDKTFALNHKPHKSHFRNGTVLYISSFALLPDYQGKSIARQFFASSLAAICGAFSQIKTIVLLANEEWKSALHIYETLGFTEVRRLPEFFPSLHKKERSTGIVMTCSADTFRKDGILRHNENGSVVIGGSN